VIPASRRTRRQTKGLTFAIKHERDRFEDQQTLLTPDCRHRDGITTRYAGNDPYSGTSNVSEMANDHGYDAWRNNAPNRTNAAGKAAGTSADLQDDVEGFCKNRKGQRRREEQSTAHRPIHT
jgi:hypothetical protein